MWSRYVKFTQRRVGVSARRWILPGASAVLVLGTAGTVGCDGASLTTLPHIPSKWLVLEDFSRPLQFWTEMFPIFLDYKYTQFKVSSLPDNDQDKAFQQLHEKYAKTVLQLILKLRGLFIKLGQVAAMRPDMFPDEYRKELVVLLDSVPGIQGNEAIDLVEKALGKKIDDVFIEFDPVPLGAASIGQVHKATLKNGRKVVVKVKYTDSERLFGGDMKTTKMFCKLAQPEYLLALEEMDKQFMREFDFNREAWALDKMKKQLLPHFKNVVVPAPVFELCNRDCVVMDYIPGVRLLDRVVQDFNLIAYRSGMTMEELQQHPYSLSTRLKMGAFLTAYKLRDFLHYPLAWSYNWTLGWILPNMPYPHRFIDRHKLMKTLLDVQAHQTFIGRFFQGDPHLGNFLLTPDNKLGLIDFGQVKSLSKKDTRTLAELLQLIKTDDREAIIQFQHDIGFKTQKSDPYVIYKTVVVLFDRDDRTTCEGMNLQQFMEKLDRMDRTVSIPDQYVFAIRANILLRGIANLLGITSVSLVKEFEPYAIKALAMYPPGAPDDEFVQDYQSITVDTSHIE